MRIRCQRKLTFIGILVLLSLFLCCTASAAGVFAGGDGTAENPYQITTVEQLIAVNDDLDACYILMNDLDLSGIANWEPIGGQTGSFEGTFNGNGHVISNIHLEVTVPPHDSNDVPDLQYGLFSNLHNATITCLGIEDAAYTISATSSDRSSGPHGIFIGGFAGTAGYSLIDQCYFSGSLAISAHTPAEYYIGYNIWGGGITGGHENSTISNCYTTGNITGSLTSVFEKDDSTINLGGITGSLYNMYNTVSTCYTTAEISLVRTKGLSGRNGSECYIGGICARSISDMRNCVAMPIKLSATGNNTYAHSLGMYATTEECYVIDPNSDEALSRLYFETAGFDFQNIWAVNQSHPRLQAFGHTNTSSIYKLELYGNRSNFGINSGTTINITARLYCNDELVDNVPEGYTCSFDPTYMKLESEDESVFTFKTLNPGKTTLTITETKTRLSLTIPIEIVDPNYYDRCSAYLSNKEVEMNAGLYIPASEYSCTEQNGRHSVSFNIYNGSHSYGLVEAYDKSGKLIRRQVIKPSKYGSGIEVAIKGYVELYFLLASDLADYQILCECTPIRFDNLPEHAEIRIITDPLKSPLVAAYNFVDMALQLVFLDPVLPPDIPSSDFIEFTKTLTEDLVDEFSDVAMESFASSATDFIQKWDGRITEATSIDFRDELLSVIQKLFIEAGLDFLESIKKAAYTTLNTTITTLLESLDPSFAAIFLYVDFQEIHTTMQHNLYCLNSDNIEIDIINHSKTNTFTDEMVTVTQEDFFDIDTILDVYVVVKEDELGQFAESLTADMNKFSIFSITLRQNGEEIQPDGPITVRIPIPEGANPDECVLYWLETADKRIFIPTTQDGNYLVFVTDHLSYYMIGEKATQPADYTAVEAAIAQANALIPSDYVDFSGVQLAIDAVVYDLDSTKQAQVDAMAQAILDQIALLVPLTSIPADYTAVEAAIAQANALIPNDYVDFSGVQLAIDAVVYNLDSTKQAQVDAMARAILDQIALLVPITVQPTPTLTPTPTPSIEETVSPAPFSNEIPPKAGDHTPLGFIMLVTACAALSLTIIGTSHYYKRKT